jgi:hypothetical protein
LRWEIGRLRESVVGVVMVIRHLGLRCLLW